MQQPPVLLLLSVFLLASIPGGSQADPQTFPDFPDSPNPGGESAGGDKTPPYEYREPYFLGKPSIFGVGMSAGKISFRFSSSGPVMRYNVVWSRPGKEQSASVWHDSNGFEEDDAVRHVLSTTMGYMIPERPLWDTEYTIKVQAETWWWHNQSTHQITPFAEVTFRTPPNPAISERIDVLENKKILESANPTRLTTTTLESAGAAAMVAGRSATTAQATSRSAAYRPLTAGLAGTPAAPPPPVPMPPPVTPAPPPSAEPPSVVPQPDPSVPVVFTPPLLEDNAQLWACLDAAAGEANAGECSGAESAQAYCQLRGAQSGPGLRIADAQPGTPVRAVNGDVCQNAEACRVVTELQCDR